MLDLRLFGGNSFFYPAKDNTYLCFKALEQGDRDKFLEGFKKLSKKSIYHRFFGFMKELTPAQVDDLLNTDEQNHVAWAAFDFVGEDSIGIGVGRFRRSIITLNEAELALTVIDEYQQKGVGSVLLAIMYYLGGMLDIDVFTGLIMSDNSKLIRRFSELGAKMTRVGTEYEMRLPVYKDFNKLPNTRYSNTIRPVLKFLKDNDFCV